jgi:hypothetical protein
MKLAGSYSDDKILGSFIATSSDGGFYLGKFTAVRWGDFTGDEECIDPIAPGDPLAYQPTLYFDPDLYWHNYQFGKAKMDGYLCYKLFQEYYLNGCE